MEQMRAHEHARADHNESTTIDLRGSNNGSYEEDESMEEDTGNDEGKRRGTKLTGKWVIPFCRIIADTFEKSTIKYRY